MSADQDTSERKLSPEARELIRGYLLKVCIPSGVALTVVSFALGFLINLISPQAQILLPEYLMKYPKFSLSTEKVLTSPPKYWFSLSR